MPNPKPNGGRAASSDPFRGMRPVRSEGAVYLQSDPIEREAAFAFAQAIPEEMQPAVVPKTTKKRELFAWRRLMSPRELLIWRHQEQEKRKAAAEAEKDCYAWRRLPWSSERGPWYEVTTKSKSTHRTDGHACSCRDAEGMKPHGVVCKHALAYRLRGCGTLE